MSNLDIPWVGPLPGFGGPKGYVPPTGPGSAGTGQIVGIAGDVGASAATAAAAFAGSPSIAKDLGMFAGAAIVFLALNSFMTFSESAGLAALLVLGALLINNKGQIFTDLGINQ